MEMPNGEDRSLGLGLGFGSGIVIVWRQASIIAWVIATPHEKKDLKFCIHRGELVIEK